MKTLASVFSLPFLIGGTVLMAGACSSPNRAHPSEDAGADAIVFAPPPDAATGGDCTEQLKTCATADTGATKTPAVLEFVVDGSGSMLSSNKWTSEVEALDAVFDELLSQADPDLSVGMIVFSDSNDPTSSNGPYPTKKDIYPNVVDQAQHDALRKRVDPSGASGTTPSFKALSGGYKVLQGWTAPDGRDWNKVVVFMSDGQPDGDVAEQNQCIAAAKNMLANNHISTFSVGIGDFPGTASGYDPNFMGDLAVAGGTRATPQCIPHATNLNDVCHFQISPSGKSVSQLKADFIDAINKIRGLAVGCEYTLDKTGDFDPLRTNVVFTDGNGKKHCLKQDPQNGWDFNDPNDPTKVVLHGQACGDASADKQGAVHIISGCKSG